jgi:putative flippase GtrA
MCSNREWSFRTRGGRERHHEALLFFVISGIGVAVYTAPLAVSRYVLDLKVPGCRSSRRRSPIS